MSAPVIQPYTLRDRCLRAQLLVLDVDGVLTDGGIVYGSGELEIKAFHVRDGSGLKLWHLAGRRSAVITGRQSEIVAIRAAELGVAFVEQGVADKGPALTRLLDRAGVPAEAACFVGDDVPDLPAMLRCGLAVAVADACPEARAVAHYVTQARGGRGAVRETIERVLRCQGFWPVVSSQ
jgi:YrbI family 3-deoxy-D-manno-octulosonate 8-phosphate phosphatase